MDEKSIKKLNNSNYATWKLKIELLLIKDDLWSVVVDEPVNPVPVDFAKKDGQARAIIGLSVDDNQFVHLRGFTTAKAYWDRLKAVHTKSSFTAKVITLKNLCRKTLTEDGDMEDHLQEIFNLIDKLSSLGEELKPNLTIALILCSLPDSYTSLINSLEARKEEDLTIDIVREKLLEEFHRRKDTKINNEVALKTNYRKNFSNSKKNCQQKGNESSQFVCKHCGKIRHLMKNCFFLKNKNKSQNNYHKANKAAFEDKEVCVRVNLKEDISNSWFIDSAASCHMTNNKQFFDCFSSSDDNIILADGSKVKALGRGDNEIMEENNHQSDNEENNHQNDNEENRNQYPVNTSTGVIRFSERRNKGIPPDRYRCAVVIEESQEPKNFKEIDLRSDKQEWLKAIENEMKSLHNNDTWTLVETPKNRKIINSK